MDGTTGEESPVPRTHPSPPTDMHLGKMVPRKFGAQEGREVVEAVQRAGQLNLRSVTAPDGLYTHMAEQSGPRVVPLPETNTFAYCGVANQSVFHVGTSNLCGGRGACPGTHALWNRTSVLVQSPIIGEACSSSSACPRREMACGSESSYARWCRPG